MCIINQLLELKKGSPSETGPTSIQKDVLHSTRISIQQDLVCTGKQIRGWCLPLANHRGLEVCTSRQDVRWLGREDINRKKQELTLLSTKMLGSKSNFGLYLLSDLSALFFFYDLDYLRVHLQQGPGSILHHTHWTERTEY